MRRLFVLITRYTRKKQIAKATWITMHLMPNLVVKASPDRPETEPMRRQYQ